MADEVTQVVDRPDKSRYDISVDGEVVGFCSYRDTGDVFLLPHAEVDPRVGGRGIGTLLARGTLDDLRTRGIKVVPLCPFIADFIAKNPDYKDLVAQ
jgi:predicted GNAT family acetyltransferase